MKFLCAGITAAAVYNSGFSPPDKPVSPLDFVPGEPKKDEGFDLRKLDPDQQAAYIIGTFTQGRYTQKKA